MRPKTIAVLAAGSPYLIPVSYRAAFTSIQVDAIGTVDYTVSYTMQNIYNIVTPATNADWTPITGMTGATADAVAKVDASIFAIKVVINSGAGTAEITVSQPDDG